MRAPSARRGCLATAVLFGLALLPAAPAQAAEPGGVTGIAFSDTDRDGVQDADEQPRAGDVVYLLDSTGRAVAAATTDAGGGYGFGGLAAGTWSVAYSASTWWPIRDELVPTTTGSLRPKIALTVSDGATTRADFGWRAIVRSTTAGAPVTAHTGPEGLRVESYNDAVTADEVYAALAAGTIGAPGGSVVVRFGLGSSSTTTTVVGASDGRYTSFAATAYVAYDTWLDGGDQVLSHEYGHAWSLYHAYLTQQDPTLEAYLQARGLAEDPRVGTGYAWSAPELVAEDYRQLLGSPSAAAAPQLNQEIPPATQVPGLRDFLATTFTKPPTTAGTSPSPTASSSPSPSPSPSSTATSSPSPSPSPTAAPTRRKSSGCKKPC